MDFIDCAMRVHLNSGDGRTFTTSDITTLSWASSVQEFTQLGDVDGDGDVDWMGLRSSVDSYGYDNWDVVVYKNDGAGSFSQSCSTFSLVSTLAGRRPSAFRLGDLDGDGDLDAMVYTIALRNDGTGVSPPGDAANGEAYRSHVRQLDNYGTCQMPSRTDPHRSRRRQ